MKLPDPASTVWVDGAEVSGDRAGIPLDDPGAQAGLGLFETLAVRDGRVLDLADHLERMSTASERLGIPLPPRETLRATVLRAAASERAPFGWLKILATRGGRSIVLTGAMDPAEEGRSVTAVLLPWRRNPAGPLSGLKTLNYAANEIGLEEARRRGADEGIWLNSHGHLAEGCTSNLFVVQGRKLFTPGEREGILPGVVRGLVLRAAGGLGFARHEGKVRQVRLLRAGEAFLTSSLCGVRPLISFNGRPVGTGRPGPVTLRLAGAVGEMRQAEGEDAKVEEHA
jgi:branched-subunit amino acid aminotransferase/4-amino-4-deoxychorismate lyase